MKIFDMHIHARTAPPVPELLLSRLADAGIYGCSVISNRPLEMNPETGTDFDARLSQVLEWSRGYEDRIVPILWIHPKETEIKKKICRAVDAGVAAFKVICNNFYVGDPISMDMMEAIAETGKPVIFHSGISWDGTPSSHYNRPANWEALLELKNLKFSLAHCSWPWIDECIAVYGKFLNALSKGKTVEMFVDLTPGTPEIYREELFYKLFSVGYDVPNNIMYGTDSRAENYQTAWAKKWLAIDTALFDKFNIPPKMRQKIFHDNFMRFLGRSDVKVERFIPLPDSQTVWTPELER
jgi:predicted TIM-barrel fold metal-dependent hydrolase